MFIMYIFQPIWSNFRPRREKMFCKIVYDYLIRKLVASGTEIDKNSYNLNHYKFI